MEEIMKLQKTYWRGLVMLLISGAGLILLPMEVRAQTQGDVAMQLAQFLALDASSQANAANALSSVAIMPKVGWNLTGSPTQADFICTLLSSVDKALTAKKIKTPAGLDSPSALVAAALIAAGISNRYVSEVMVSSCGAKKDEVAAGAAYGVSVSTGVPSVAARPELPAMRETFGPGGGGAGGGGGVTAGAPLTGPGLSPNK